MAQAVVPKRAVALRVALAAAVTAVALWVMAEAVSIMGAEFHSAPVRLQVTRWSAAETPWHDEEWQQAEAALQAALRLTPRDATLHEHLALLHTLPGRLRWGDGGPASPGVAHYRQALAAQQAAVQLRPMHAAGWASLSLMHYAVSDPAEATFQAWRRALALGPNEPEVIPILKAVATLTWQFAPPDVLVWLEQQEPGSVARLRAAAQAASGAATAASASEPARSR